MERKFAPGALAVLLMAFCCFCGTVAEGWLEDAVAFWKRQMTQKSA